MAAHRGRLWGCHVGGASSDWLLVRVHRSSVSFAWHRGERHGPLGQHGLDGTQKSAEATTNTSHSEAGHASLIVMHSRAERMHPPWRWHTLILAMQPSAERIYRFQNGPVYPIMSCPGHGGVRKLINRIGSYMLCLIMSFSHRLIM